MNALTRLHETILGDGSVDISEPFLVPCRRFDSIAPGDASEIWILASVLEELELIGTFSSFYSRASALPRLETIRELGFASPEMQRRLNLVQERIQLTAPNPTARISVQTHIQSPAAQEPLARFLLVKAHVGFADRLQCLSHAMAYAGKYQRTLPVCNEHANRPMWPFFQPLVRTAPWHSKRAANANGVLTGHWYLAEDFKFSHRARQSCDCVNRHCFHR